MTWLLKLVSLPVENDLFGYKFDRDDGAESPFKASGDMSRDYFSKSRKLSTNRWRFKERNRATTFFLFILNISNTSRLEWLSIALQENIMRESMILNAQI